MPSTEALTVEGARAAYRVGLARSRAARERGGSHRFGWRPTGRDQRHVDGMSALAEWTVAVVTGRRWTSDGLVPDAADAGDVDGAISVRWTAYPDGLLIVHEDEPDHLRCVLVRGPGFPLTVVGWCYAHEAKTHGTWRTDVRHPAFFVRPFRSIRTLIVSEGEVDGQDLR